jgi:phosphate:Na+ symporter
MIVGQSVGTAATSALLLFGGGLAVRRAALAHIVYNMSVGILGMVLLRPIAAAADWVGAQLYDPDGVLALAAFSSIFKLVGVAAFFPWLDGLSRFIVRISGTGTESAVARLEPTLAAAGGSVALEAAWRAILETAHASVDVVRRRLAGEAVRYDPPVDAVRQIEQFLESLSLETFDLGAIEPRLVRLCHALDHLASLLDDLQQVPAVDAAWQPPGGFAAGARALGAWLDTTRDPAVLPDPAIFTALGLASTQLSAERKAGRDAMLEDVAVQRTPAAAARRVIDTLALHHAWRLAESLRIASGSEPASRRKER